MIGYLTSAKFTNKSNTYYVFNRKYFYFRNVEV